MPIAVVTGAFSNTGAAVAAELIRRGWSVRTLTNRAPPPGSAVPSMPLRFEVSSLTRTLAGADALVNTYWVRFPRGEVTFDSAVRDSKTLIRAAREAGVARCVQISVSNASESSTLGYYRGKALVDRLVRESGLSWAIVRPTLIVGPKDVLTHNIAWFLRRAPVFAVPSREGHRMQPVLLDDVARLVADALESREALEVDAAGPEVVTFAEYVRRLGHAIGVPRPIVSLPAPAILGVLQMAGALLHDTVLTPEELEGLRQELLVSQSPALGSSSVFEWLQGNGARFGRSYVNDTRVRVSVPPDR